MTFNRIADRAIDAANPRTATRALPAGLLDLSSRPFCNRLFRTFLVAASQLID